MSQPHLIWFAVALTLHGVHSENFIWLNLWAHLHRHLVTLFYGRLWRLVKRASIILWNWHVLFFLHCYLSSSFRGRQLPRYSNDFDHAPPRQLFAFICIFRIRRFKVLIKFTAHLLFLLCTLVFKERVPLSTTTTLSKHKLSLCVKWYLTCYCLALIALVRITNSGIPFEEHC